MATQPILEEIIDKIKQHVPRTTDITQVEFEGAEVAIYARNPQILMDDESILRDLARSIKKRIVVRSDPSVRLPEEDSRRLIQTILSDEEVTVSDIIFDPTVGEVIIEADKPGAVIGKDAVRLREIVSKTKWRPRVVRTPPIPSKIVQSIRHILASDKEIRIENLRRIGQRIHRPPVFDNGNVRITALGGYLEVGRTANLVQTGESTVLVDCGVNVGATRAGNALPRFDLPEFDIDNLDAVIISHAHLDHSGFVPFLYKYGYKGPVYTTPPTRDLMTMLQLDYLDIAEKEGKLLPYSQTDIKNATLHTITLNYGEVTDIAPDIRLTFYNAGHIVGSAIVHLHIGEGLYNIAFAHDFKYAKTRLLDRANTRYPRLEAIIMESTYGNPKDVLPSRQESEQRLARIIKQTVERGGKILIPVLAVGRAQEIMIILEGMMRHGKIPEVPIYTEGMISEATAITTANPEFLSRSLRDRIFHAGSNPFLAEYFHQVTSKEEREEIIHGEPAIIMATSGMLSGGPSVFYFHELAEDERNSLIFVSYQGKGTLGRKIAEGAREIPIHMENGKTRALGIKMQIEQISGFTGHSDRKELIDFAKHLSPRPQKYILVHGEQSKCQALASSIHRITKRETMAPPIGQTVLLD